MDPTKPAIEIYYGKYLDKIDNKIPNDHIDPDKNRTFPKTIEPGKPNFPTSDSVTITLENMDAEGNYRYDKQWFIDNSKSEAEGAKNPFEIFFRIYVYGEESFTGIYSSKSYTMHNQQVEIEITDISGLFDRDKFYVLKPFKFDNSYLENKATRSDSANDLGVGTDLENDDTNQILLIFSLINTDEYAWDSGKDFTDEYTAHANLRGYNSTTLSKPANNDGNEEITHETIRITYVQIGDITLLTRIKEQVVRHNFTDNVGNSYYWMELRLFVWHANNGNYTEEGKTVLERGRFFANADTGQLLNQGSNYNVRIWDYDLGNDQNILFQKDNLPFAQSAPLTRFLHGSEFVTDSNLDYSIVQTDYAWTDVLDTMTSSIKNYYSNYFDSIISASLFDLSKVPADRRKGFWADAIMFGWLEDKQKVSQTIVNLARQVNCFLYTDGRGRIVFQPRDDHKSHTDQQQLPPNSVDLDAEPHKWHSGQGEDGGFETFTVTVSNDIVEINNLKSDENTEITIDDQGARVEPSVRNSDLSISNYRVNDLGVPRQEVKSQRKVFRYSPEDPSFPNYSSNLIDEFIPTAKEQALSFAKTLDWPVEYLYPSLPGQKFTDVDLGGYMHRENEGNKEVYLVMDITRTSDLWKKVTLKKEAEWEV